MSRGAVSYLLPLACALIAAGCGDASAGDGRALPRSVQRRLAGELRPAQIAAIRDPGRARSALVEFQHSVEAFARAGEISATSAATLQRVAAQAIARLPGLSAPGAATPTPPAATVSTGSPSGPSAAPAGPPAPPPHGHDHGHGHGHGGGPGGGGDGGD